MIDWLQLRPRLAWTRCHRRRWDATPELAFSREQRHKPRHVLLYFWAGHGRRVVPSGEVAVAAGSCHWSRPGWSYACHQVSDDPLGITAIHFDLVGEDGAPVPPEQIALPPEVLTVSAPALAKEVTDHISQLALRVRAGVDLAPSVASAAETLLHGLLRQLAADTAGQPAARRAEAGMWTEVAHYIQENLQDLPPVAHLAERWGFSRYHFSHRFAAHFGLSPRAYITNARLALAKELLRETNLNATQVAAMAGYNSLPWFSNSFRDAVGLSPTEYRQRESSCADAT